MDSITDLERITAAHWRGTEEERLGEWLLRAADGYTGRANSALPLGDSGLPLDEALATVTAWYRARGLPSMIAVPLPLLPDAGSPGSQLDVHLAERSWETRPAPAFVMVADLPLGVVPVGLPGGAELRLDAEPDDAWLAGYHHRGQGRRLPVIRKVLGSAPEQAFLSIRSGASVLAVARLSIASGWAGITAVEVDQAHRRLGLGTVITTAACARAAASGIRRVFLQVEVGNAAARTLYERCGFRYSHRYHYRIAPA